MTRLAGRTALVTDAVPGIGSTVAARFATDGAPVMVRLAGRGGRRRGDAST